MEINRRNRVRREAHPPAIDCGSTNGRNCAKELAFFFLRRLGGGFERAFCYQQSDWLEVKLAVCGPGRQCARTLAGERSGSIVEYRVARWEAPGNCGTHVQQQVVGRRRILGICMFRM